MQHKESIICPTVGTDMYLGPNSRTIIKSNVLKVPKQKQYVALQDQIV